MEALAGWLLIAWLYRKWKAWDERRNPPVDLPPWPPAPPRSMSEAEYRRLLAETEAREQAARQAAEGEPSPFVSLAQLEREAALEREARGLK